jgi:hypothetical protein
MTDMASVLADDEAINDLIAYVGTFQADTN